MVTEGPEKEVCCESGTSCCSCVWRRAACTCHMWHMWHVAGWLQALTLPWCLLRALAGADLWQLQANLSEELLLTCNKCSSKVSTTLLKMGATISMAVACSTEQQTSFSLLLLQAQQAPSALCPRITPDGQRLWVAHKRAPSTAASFRASLYLGRGMQVVYIPRVLLASAFCKHVSICAASPLLQTHPRFHSGCLECIKGATHPSRFAPRPQGTPAIFRVSSKQCKL